ncbi:MarR family winged helix-turn-helix transcriptional regulator [Antarcticirhabdus aurantiaca]|uniref:MarR family winged helix-turn-helix transcriptional regulator n=1 Tax=Antarcticirhabdus aurantiaca TaxID=2606717 RepID=A0ACD4NSL9_9HYPH|nr:MarR family winged helix-turn-helix transcriptional regulator [Antarcticirhabdus aurantiaca]WAJ29666.1 MarR family winged helix-turn-helix transcriptional regulator [Jeongeuplla avenae]
MDGVLSGSVLGFVLGDAARLWWQCFDRALDAANVALTGGEVRTLVHIAYHPNLSLRELAAHMGVKPMTASEFVTRLEARGLVTRAVDPVDRRARRLEATPAARRVFEKIQPIALGVHQNAVGQLGAGEREELTRLLSAVRDSLVPAASAVPLRETAAKLA